MCGLATSGEDWEKKVKERGEKITSEKSVLELARDRGPDIIDATGAASVEWGLLYGPEWIALEQEHLDALLAGKMLAWTDGEYSTFVFCGPVRRRLEQAGLDTMAEVLADA